MSRAFTITWASFLGLALACGGGGESPFVIEVAGDDGTVAGSPIAPEVVDRVQIVIAPQPIDGLFAPMPERVFEGGRARTRISAAGEWVLTLERAWLDDHAAPGDVLRFSTLLSREDSADGATTSPTLRVLFYRGPDVIAESTPLNLEWPLRPGGEVSVTVLCRFGLAAQCAGP